MYGPRIVTVALGALTVVVACAAITVQVLAGSGPDTAEVLLTGLIAVVTIVLGLVVAWREPANWLAAVMAWMAVLAATVGFSDTYRPAHLREPARLPEVAPTLAALLSVAWVWMYAALTLLLILFPTGRPLTRNWGRLAITIPVVSLATHAVVATSATPYDAPYADVAHPLGNLPVAVSTGLKVLLFPTLVALLLASCAALIVRYRSGDDRLQRQVKWLVLSLPLIPLTLVLSWGGYLVIGTNTLAGIGLALIYLAIPAATTTAILRHDLFDVDRTLAGAAVYSVLTVGIVGGYVGTAALSGALLGHQSPWAAALTTAGLALALAPARRRLQRAVDRALYPLRRSAYDAIAALERGIVAGMAVPEQLQETLAHALRAPALRVGVAAPGGGTFLDPSGSVVDPGNGVDVSASHERIGVIVAQGVTRQLLREVARRSTLLVKMIRLRLEATSALADARESRTRLQQVGYEERRRLERDLHDVAQQRLVALGLSMRLAQRRLAATGEGTLASMVSDWVDEVGRSTAELRALAHGIRPSYLDDGLSSALTMLAGGVPLPLDADIAVHRELSDELSTTAYHVVAEAISNALKHGHPTSLRLEVHDDDGQLMVRVRDDGTGGARFGTVGGLCALRDRVAASGGSLRVTSEPGFGTTVEAVLPCAS
jgi:signal transduction histidine kinase